MTTEGRGYSALMLYNHLAREAEAERVERYYREREIRRVPAAASQPAKNLARPGAAKKARVLPYLDAERERVCSIISATPQGAEGERDHAIASGMSVDTFHGILAGLAILAARQTSND